MTTLWPAVASRRTTSGTMATRRSPSAVSAGTPILMDAATYTTPLALERACLLRDLPFVGELGDLQDQRGLHRGHSGHPAELRRDELQEVLVIREERLDDDVVAACGHADVADFGQHHELIGYPMQPVQLDRDADDRRGGHAHGLGRGHRDDGDEALVRES